MKKKLIVQGDVPLHRVTEIPKDAVDVTNKKVANIKNKRCFVLREGELTGHAHTIPMTDKMRILEKNGIMYLSVDEDQHLSHNTHKTIHVNKGG